MIRRNEPAVRDDGFLAGQSLKRCDPFLEFPYELCRIPFSEHETVRAGFGSVVKQDINVRLANAAL